MNKDNLNIIIVDAIKNIVSSTNSVEYDVKDHVVTKGFFNPKPVAKVTNINIIIREPI